MGREPQPGDHVGRYEIVRSLGAGGMAATWLANAPNGDPVVVKMPLDDEAGLIARFRDEARVGTRVAHPNLVETLDLVEHDGLPALILAFIDGASLSELTRDVSFNVSTTALIGAQAAAALDAVHTATDEAGTPLGIVHRDVSASNLLVSRQGSTHLIDLGIARSSEALHKTQTGMLLGTLPTMAPELFADAPPSRGTDIWALGCVLFQVATGKPLFRKDSMAAVIGNVLAFDPETVTDMRWAAIADPLRAVLARALCPRPEGRIVDARLLSEQLWDLVGDEDAARTVLAAAAERALGDQTRTFRVTNSFYFPEEGRQGVTRAVDTGDWVAAFDAGMNEEWSPAAETRSTVETSAADLLRSGEATETHQVSARAPADYPPAPRLPSDVFRAPVVAEAPLELAYRSGGGAPAPAAWPGGESTEIVPAIEEERKPRGWRGPVLGAVIVLSVIVLWGIAVMVDEFGGYFFDDEPEAPPADELRPLSPSDEEVLARPANAPECYTGVAGQFFLYRQSNGTQVVEERLENVPRSKRRTARCVTPGR